ncbi:hypothetical protein HMPREF0322_02608 [Desulfitobacterium hafniense DP7]|uniref:Uncharacterized protein n=1 Tax=Desulfitobacterium hafniense DP7 TaxID=537010 RepID=G9XNR4_DESHA|nr:hypothetical protein HMPREF0322_02608 [Desulfitobacterium hafniense DP7]
MVFHKLFIDRQKLRMCQSFVMMPSAGPWIAKINIDLFYLVMLEDTLQLGNIHRNNSDIMESLLINFSQSFDQHLIIKIDSYIIDMRVQLCTLIDKLPPSAAQFKMNRVVIAKSLLPIFLIMHRIIDNLRITLQLRSCPGFSSKSHVILLDVQKIKKFIK